MKETSYVISLNIVTVNRKTDPSKNFVCNRQL